MHRITLLSIAALGLAACADRAGPVEPLLTAEPPSPKKAPGGSTTVVEPIQDALDRLVPALGPAGDPLAAALVQLRTALTSGSTGSRLVALRAAHGEIDRLENTLASEHAAELAAIRLSLAHL
jgi:hypothetical protein